MRQIYDRWRNVRFSGFWIASNVVFLWTELQAMFKFGSSKLSSGSVRFTKAKVQFKFSSSLRFSVRVQSKFGSKFMNKTVTWLNPNLFMNFEPNPWISSGSVQVQILYVQFRFGSSSKNSDMNSSSSVQVQGSIELEPNRTEPRNTNLIIMINTYRIIF